MYKWIKNEMSENISVFVIWKNSNKDTKTASNVYPPQCFVATIVF